MRESECPPVHENCSIGNLAIWSGCWNYMRGKAAFGLWMTASTFDLLLDGGAGLTIPTTVSGDTGTAITDMELLATTPVAELRELAFPYPGDATDVFTLKTDRGTGYLDQGTGALLAWADLTAWDVRRFRYPVGTRRYRRRDAGHRSTARC